MTKIQIKDLSMVEELSDEQTVNIYGGTSGTLVGSTPETPGGRYPSVTNSPPPPPPKDDPIPGIAIISF